MNEQPDSVSQTDGGRVASVDATAARRPLVSESSSWLRISAVCVVTVSFVAMLVGIAVLARLIPPTASTLGVTVDQWLGAVLALTGSAVIAFGSLSYYGVVETNPDRTVGVGVGAAYGLTGFVIGFLVGSQALGLSLVGWLSIAAVCAAFGFVVSVVPREDLGATVPPGILALTSGILVLAGVIAPGLRWSPAVSSITVPGDMAIALLAVVVGLFVAWTAARAYGGFGPNGKQTSAYLLISANAAWMLGLLVVLVAFVVSKGLTPVLEGIQIGVFTQPVFWFYASPIQAYVVVELPGIWFFWPFAMNGASVVTEVNGVMPAIVGTVWLVVGAILFALPLGVGTAVFLTEYAEQGRFTRIVEVSTNGLWSTPSIVYGLFGLAFLVPRLGNTNSILAGQLVLGFMLLPLVVITSREALKGVSDEYRDASAALGVGKWETVKSVVLPAAMPGITTGVILGVGRIAGETAPILLVTGGAPFPNRGPNILQSFELSVAVNSQLPFVHVGLSNPALLQPASALPYQLYTVISAGVGENLAFAWGTALMLLLVVLGFYAIGIASRIYFRKKLNA